VSEPQHPDLWEAWKRASDAFEACECLNCTSGGSSSDALECEAWLALGKAKRAYINAKEEHL